MIDEFEQIGRVAMLEKCRGGRARNWNVNGEYDLKRACRAAHENQGFGPLPPVPESFRTYDARAHLGAHGLPVDYVE